MLIIFLCLKKTFLLRMEKLQVFLCNWTRHEISVGQTNATFVKTRWRALDTDVSGDCYCSFPFLSFLFSLIILLQKRRSISQSYWKIRQLRWGKILGYIIFWRLFLMFVLKSNFLVADQWSCWWTPI